MNCADGDDQLIVPVLMRMFERLMRAGARAVPLMCSHTRVPSRGCAPAN